MNNFKPMLKVIFVSVFIIAVVFSAAAQGEQVRYREGLDITLSRTSVITMITVYPGDQVYSVFGHSAFRVYDPENGIDWMYNYGTFDFTDDFFVLKFIEGKLDYYLDVDYFPRAFHFYTNVEQRKIYEQILNFNLEERQALFDFLQKNAEPENRVYRYDFIWDNCSTRIADAIDKTFPALIDYSAYRGTGESFRKMIMAYLEEKPFINFGIQLVFGKPTDRIPKGHEIFFLPIYMKQAFSAAIINNGEAETTPLVFAEAMIASPERTFQKKLDYPLFIFLSVLIIYFISFVLQAGKNILSNSNPAVLKLSGIVSAVCEGFVFLFTGIIGILITYLWFFSEHRVTSFNFTYLWCTPLNLILFIGVFLKTKSSFPKKLFISLTFLSIIMCAAYLVCIAAGVQHAIPAFFPIIIFLIIAGGKKLIALWLC